MAPCGSQPKVDYMHTYQCSCWWLYQGWIHRSRNTRRCHLDWNISAGSRRWGRGTRRDLCMCPQGGWACTVHYSWVALWENWQPFSKHSKWSALYFECQRRAAAHPCPMIWSHVADISIITRLYTMQHSQQCNIHVPACKVLQRVHGLPAFMVTWLNSHTMHRYVYLPAVLDRPYSIMCTNVGGSCTVCRIWMESLHIV